VLNWQRTQCELEETRTKQLAAGLQQLQAEQTALDESRQTANRTVLDAQSPLPGDLSALAGYRRVLDLKQRQLAEAVRQCEQRLAAQRKRWTEARRRCRLLEKLKERRRAEYDYEMNRELESLASETFLARWNAS